MDEIRFYRVLDPYGFLSNFSPHPVVIDQVGWPTTEHYFQASKFPHVPARQEAIRKERSPPLAKRIAWGNGPFIREDWDQVRDDVMRRALSVKFTQHPELGRRLVATGDATLVEHTSRDSYWGDGGDGSGENRLGILLMELRAELT